MMQVTQGIIIEANEIDEFDEFQDNSSSFGTGSDVSESEEEDNVMSKEVDSTFETSADLKHTSIILNEDQVLDDLVGDL